MPTPTDAFVIAVLVLTLITPYVLYPLLVRLVPRVRRRSGGSERGPLPSVSILIPAHNEAERIAQKIENVLSLDYPENQVEVLVASDGSDDATAAIARRYESMGVKVFELKVRRGKLGALTFLLEHTRGQVTMFTDVGAVLPANALIELAGELSDPGVGVAVPRYVAQGKGSASAASDAAYWGRETKLKQLEADRDMLLGAHGACYVMRRHLVLTVPPDTIHDDFVWPMLARERGPRVVYRPDLLVVDDAPTRLSTVFERTARMAHGNLQMLIRYRRLLSPARGRLALSLVGHKLLKTLGPVWIGALIVFVNVRAIDHEAFVPLALIGDLLLLGAMGAAALGWDGASLPRPFAIVAHGLVAQLACAIGMGRYLFGLEGVRWRRPRENQVLQLTRPAQPPRSVRILKRTLDVLGAGIGLLLASPVMLLAAIAIRLNSRGPVIYRQERLALDIEGRTHPFVMWKFRSMRLDAEADGRPVWAEERDPRITSVGAFLRKSRLDELPQLFQVLRGEMSLVGPRPERPAIADELAIQLPGYDDRLMPCKPGITGWAQIHTGYDTCLDSVREKLLYDFTYNAHLYDLRSYIAMELRVVTRTVAVMIFGRGAR